MFLALIGGLHPLNDAEKNVEPNSNEKDSEVLGSCLLKTHFVN